jgi:hypothetical protein
MPWLRPRRGAAMSEGPDSASSSASDEEARIALEARADELYREQWVSNVVRIDRIFSALFGLQWLLGVTLAL